MSRFLLIILTIAVMIAFAMNSIIGRAALRSSDEPIIDPATYTLVRIVSGAIVLAFIQFARRRRSEASSEVQRKAGWLPGCMLSLYAIAFSFAYVGLDAASGTLILFAFVQLTMVGFAAAKGERPKAAELAGLAVASVGLLYLLAPDLQKSSFVGESALMMLAGIGWGSYSVFGKGSGDPIGDTAANFARSIVFVVIASALFWNRFTLESRGFWLAAASGGLTSGLGYVLWYTVLPKLRSTQAAAAQLSVPILAAVGGTFVGDPLTSRTVVAGLLILGGIAMTVEWKPKAAAGVHQSNSE